MRKILGMLNLPCDIVKKINILGFLFSVHDLDLEVLVENIRSALKNTHNLRLCLVSKTFSVFHFPFSISFYKIKI